MFHRSGPGLCRSVYVHDLEDCTQSVHLHLLAVASMLIPSGCSLHPVKIREGEFWSKLPSIFLLYAYYSMCTFNKKLPSFISPPENDSFRKDLCFTHDVLLVRPKAIACGADLSFTPDVFLFIFFHSRNLRDATAFKFDREYLWKR